MRPPQQLFGFPARWTEAIRPQSSGVVTIAGVRIEILRWELQDVTVDGLELPSDGHVITYAVDAGGQTTQLSQQTSTFFLEENARSPDYLEGQIAQGDGVLSPRWYKADRLWPVSGGQPFRFLGQAHLNQTMIYLFRHPTVATFAIFAEQLDRQDAEEHYAEETRRLWDA